MAKLTEPLIHALQDEPNRYTFWCPGCKCGHWFQTDGSPSWQFNGDRFESPTISPSIRVRGGKQGNDHVCHFFVRNGKIQFLRDCTHELKGKTVPMEHFP